MNASNMFNQTLTLNLIASELVEQGFIDDETKEKLLSCPKGQRQAKQHVIETIEQCNLKTTKDEPLNTEWLLNWLATWSDQSLFHIDPLKIDSLKVAQVMSFAFAQRHQILAVDIQPRFIVIASTEPFKVDWEDGPRPYRRPLRPHRAR